MASDEDKSPFPGEHVTSNIQEEVIKSSRPEGDPISTRVFFTDPGEPDDPDEKFNFPSTTFSLMRFTEISMTKCNADGTRKNKRAPIALVHILQFELCRWMCSNHYLHDMQPGQCRTTLKPFKQQYNLYDHRKDERARRYFKGEIDECARRFSNQVKKEQGYIFVFAKVNSHEQRRVVEYQSGYDYLERIDCLKWDGKMRRIILEPSLLQEICFLQTSEIETLRAHCTKVLNDRNPPAEASGIDLGPESSSEKPNSTPPRTSKVST